MLLAYIDLVLVNIPEFLEMAPSNESSRDAYMQLISPWSSVCLAWNNQWRASSIMNATYLTADMIAGVRCAQEHGSLLEHLVHGLLSQRKSLATSRL